VESGEGIERLYALHLTPLQKLVESGEGIERSPENEYLNLKVINTWNPVKELKDHVHVEYYSGYSDTVESGEGIERLKTCKLSPLVGSSGIR